MTRRVTYNIAAQLHARVLCCKHDIQLVLREHGCCVGEREVMHVCVCMDGSGEALPTWSIIV